jgi:hypothetical protein
VLGVLAIFIPGLPLYYRAVQIPCAGASAAAGCFPGQLAPSAIQALAALGTSLRAYAAFATAVILASSLVFFAVGALIAYYRWNDGVGLFVSLVLIMLGATGISDTLTSGLVMLPLGPSLLWLRTAYGILVTAVIVAQWPTFGVLLLTFPTGRFTPRWSALVLLLWGVDEIAFNVHAQALATVVAIPITLAATAAVLVYRYLRVYGPSERQRTKWLVVAVAAGLAVSVLILLAQALAPTFGLPASPPQATDLLRSVVVFVPIAVAIGVAILRYRLYDIDVIINRALVYGSLTATLALVYFATVLATQSIVHALTGQRTEPPIFIVATTLLIAALFNPLRVRLQAAIDQRFYRHRYDAARTLHAFSGALRTETDLGALSEQLMGVVEETMRPARVTLWLRPVAVDDALDPRAMLSRPTPLNPPA